MLSAQAVGGNKPYGTQPANSLAVAAALAAEKSAEAAAAAAEAAHLWTTLYQQASTIEKEYHYVSTRLFVSVHMQHMPSCTMQHLTLHLTRPPCFG